MTPLASAIQSLGLSGTAAEIRTALNADVAMPHDRTLWTYNGVAQAFGSEAAEGIAQAIAAAGLPTAVTVYAARGFDLSLDQTREQLDEIATGVPALAQVCVALKAIGRPTAKRYATAGLDALPSEVEITAALAEIADDEKYNYVLGNLIPGARAQGKTWAETKALIAGVE